MAGHVTDRSLMLKQDAQIVALFTSGMKQYEIAESLGISTRTVIRAIKRNLETVEEVDKKLSEVQRHLKRQMPIEKRVKVLVEVAEGSALDFARIGSIKYLNELDGIHPQLDREKLKRDREQPRSAPMFIFPPGTQIDVTVNQAAVPADSVSASESREVIEIESKEGIDE